ncbi:MAG: diguanylate cyclase [Granulosicoccaceae bacterium]
MSRQLRRYTDLSLVLLVSCSIGIGIVTGLIVYQMRSAEHLSTSIGEAETLLDLTNSFVSIYSSQHSGDRNALVPAVFRAAAARQFNSHDARSERPVAVMVGLAGREIETPPIDAALAARLDRMANSGTFGQFSTEFDDDSGNRMLRTVFPTIANQDSCIACHNRLQPNGPAWSKGDLMGAYVVDRSIGKARQWIFRFSLLVGLLAGVASLLGGGLYFYSKRLEIQSAKLRALANTDSLTGCLNRRALIDAFDVNGIHQQGGALFVMDLDYFKRINDEYGHDAGDHVLKHFTKMVRSQLRDIDLLARIGGEEFVVFLPDTSRSEAYLIAERTSDAIRDAEVEFNGVIVRYTVSMGAVLIPQNTDRSLSTWLSVADRFLYRAKDLGRNQIFPSAI